MEFWLLKTSKNKHFQIIIYISGYMFPSKTKKAADGQHKNFIFFGPILLEIALTTNMSFTHYPN
jgi:hypothetical protein